MAGRNFHLSNGSLFFTWLIAGIVLLLLPSSVTSKLWDVFRGTFNPILKIGRTVNSVPPLSVQPDDAATARKYQELLKDYGNLKATLEKFQDEYNKLALIRSNLPRPYGGLVLARVVGTLGHYHHEVVIDKGSSDGIQAGYYVLSGQKNSLVGVVREATPRYAKVRMLTDNKQTMEIRILNEEKGRDIGGLLIGDGKSACKIQMIQQKQKVEADDMVFAAAQPGYLNIPIVIGRVVSVEPDEQHPLLWDITVQPADAMTGSDEVAVIIAENLSEIFSERKQ